MGAGERLQQRGQSGETGNRRPDPDDPLPPQRDLVHDMPAGRAAPQPSGADNLRTPAVMLAAIRAAGDDTAEVLE
jgi:hypothetical protein